MKRKFLLSAFLSTVLLSTSLFSQNITCTGSHCKIDLKKLFPSKNTPIKITNFRKTPFILNTSISTHMVDNKDLNSEFIKLDASKYLMQEDEILEVEENAEIIVLAHAKYIAKVGEKLEYMEDDSLIAEPIEKIEDKILNKTLPTSNYYCANEKKVIYHQDSNSYECA